MKHWYAKELSKLTKVSVRTLHHYDQIGLLKPSIRQSNNYRWYSEKDLLKLQQIIALKFFGFELTQIKTLLSSQNDALQNFALQAKFLQEKAENLLEASSILTRITNECSISKSIPWENIIQLIEVYQMTQQIDHKWVKDILNPTELKQYAEFEAELKSRSTPEEKAASEADWDKFLEDVSKNLHEDPQSAIGIKFGKRLMEWVNSMYGKKYAHIRTKIFEQGFGGGKGLEEVGLTPEVLSWIQQASDTYWHDRIYSILAQVNQISSAKLLKQWNDMLDEMYGGEEARKLELIQVALKDDKISEDAKQWLKTMFNP